MRRLMNRSAKADTPGFDLGTVKAIAYVSSAIEKGFSSAPYSLAVTPRYKLGKRLHAAPTGHLLNHDHFGRRSAGAG